MKIIIIGAGFGGLSAAAYLAKAGHKVSIYEKNSHPGGRSNTIRVPSGKAGAVNEISSDAVQGSGEKRTEPYEQYGSGVSQSSDAAMRRDKSFTFELGPSWYLMPDVFDDFFADFGHKTSDFYKLKQLIPSYQVYENDSQFLARPHAAASMDFEHIEQGAGERLARLLVETKAEYDMVRQNILGLSGLSKLEYIKAVMPYASMMPRLLGSYHNRIARTVSDKTLQHVLEFMVVFLGGSPRNIPALYGLLSHVDFSLGIWYPMGGFTAVAKAVETVAKEQGVSIHYNAPVDKIITQDGKAAGVNVEGETHLADIVVANADYQFVDSHLIPIEHQLFSKQEWSKKTLSPSAVMAVVGVKKRVNLQHHSLFFDTDWDQNFSDVFDRHQINERPLFYACTPSKTDPNVAPKDHENIFILIPVSGKARVDRTVAERLVNNAITRIEHKTKQNIKRDIVVKNVYDPSYFTDTFNASSGNAFGLAHTFSQSGPLRPPIKSSKVPNLYFTGQFTNPGTGVPLVLLSGKVVSSAITSLAID